MKKTLLIAFATLAGMSLASCGSKHQAADKGEATAGNHATASEGMYEYEEEVPLTPVGQADPDALESKSGRMPYVVDFSASWCGPCRQLKPYFEQMEKVYAGQAGFRTVDIDAEGELASRYNVSAVPTVIIFSDSTMRTELYRVTGFDPQGLEQAIMEFV